MGKEYPAKSFKSGNSVAIRLPAALGVEPNREWTVHRDAKGRLIIEANPASRRTIDLTDIYGKADMIERVQFDPVDRRWGEAPSGR